MQSTVIILANVLSHFCFKKFAGGVGISDSWKQIAINNSHAIESPGLCDAIIQAVNNAVLNERLH